MTELAFYGIREPVPGPRWRALFDATWPAYRAWYLSEGDTARPSLIVGRRMLERHMPELVPTWERLVALTDHDPVAARMLTLFDPPRFLPGCSQAVLTADRPLLVRNHDYRPDLCERTVYSSAFTGRRVIGSGDCLWGLVDGMNEDGLVVSLTAVAHPAGPAGFAVPLVVRYVLETATTVAEAREVLARVPINMAYNIMLLDRSGDSATVFVAPGTRPEVSDDRAATNHRGAVPDDPVHAGSLRSVERRDALLALLDRTDDPDTLIGAFLSPPLRTTEYARGFGTIYTAAYRPDLGVVDYLWPGSFWRRDFDSPDAIHIASYTEQPDLVPVPTTASFDRPSTVVEPVGMCSREDLTGATPDELATLAESAIAALAHSPDPAAFTHLLALTRRTGESLGVAARTLADHSSWSGVADAAGTSRQAAWERWRAR